MCHDVIVTVGDPLMDKLGGAVKNLFWCHMFDHGLEIWVLVVLIEDAMDSCFQQTSILLFM